MSREHILSATILRAIGTKKIIFEGRQFSRVHSIGSSALTTRCLCKRHNSALGPLDAEAGRLFRTVQAIDAGFAARQSPSQKLYLFAGWDVERWLAKTLLNVFFSRVTNVRPGTHLLPAHATQLFAATLAAPFGLYLPARAPNGGAAQMRVAPRAAMGLMTTGNTVAGISVSLGGLELKLLITGTDADILAFQSEHISRPKLLNFYEGSEVVSVAFAWPEGGGKEVWISRGDESAPIPTSSPILNCT